MSDESKKAGLGKLIYSVDDPKTEQTAEENCTENRDIQEADEESFPASDPPGFNKGAASDPT